MNRLCLVPLLAVAWSCAPIASSGRVQPTSDPTRVLLAREIRAANVRNAYEAIRLLRPRFLVSSRGPGPIAVFVDDMPAPDIAFLRDIPAASIRDIVFLPGPEATLRYPPARGADAALVVHTAVAVR